MVSAGAMRRQPLSSKSTPCAWGTTSTATKSISSTRASA
jgi:hypothetical protein